MTKKANMIFGVIAGASLITGSAMPALAAAESTSDNSSSYGDVEASGTVSHSDTVAVAADDIEGTFSYTQGEITPNSIIRDIFRKATAALCQATENPLVVNDPLEWKLTVSGDVDNSFTATVGELANEQSVSQTMTCSCGGNPSDGAATITAEVKGIPVSYLASRASASNDANTITFVSSDGTEIAMPLMYAVGHHAVISFEINDEDLSESVGGYNQLWMAATSANYFLRDVVEIRITTEDQVPDKPGENMEYPNSPNTGILASLAE